MDNEAAPGEDNRDKIKARFLSRELRLKAEMLAAKLETIIRDKNNLELTEEILLLKTKLNYAD